MEDRMSHQNGRLASAEPREADIEMPAIASQPLVEALDQMSVGVIFVDRHGKVAYCNRCADGIIRQADGLSIVTSRLSAAVREETSELRRQIFEAVAADAADGC